MAKKTKNVAYVVFRGRKPGIYRTWTECEEQVTKYPKAIHKGFESSAEADQAWTEWQKKIAVKLESAKPPANPSRPWAESLHSPTVWIDPSTPVPKLPELRRPAEEVQSSSPGPSQLPSSQLYYFDPPAPPNTPPQDNQARGSLEMAPDNRLTRLASQSNIPTHSPSQNPWNQPSSPIDLTISSPPHQNYVPNLKRSSSFVDLTSDHEDGERNLKIFKAEVTAEERHELNQTDHPESHAQPEERRIELSPEQENVVNLALRKNNIFLTGAAGCGKTVTLKEILARFKKRKKGGNVQVIAPTGIAALPLDGRTTYSFAGWNQDSFKKPLQKLLENRQKRVIKAIRELDVLIIEEISMVENQFLERLNILFQHVLSRIPEVGIGDDAYNFPEDNTLPFGGKQVIFLGDFHQLPPVKPFANCLHCGESIPQREAPICVSAACKGATGKVAFKWNDKWAFKAPVWQQLGLRHIKLEQIHRQKDTRFQDILNKIRNGQTLTPAEWHDLERPKDLPRNAFAIHLMSLISSVRAYNASKLSSLKTPPKSWHANDTCTKLVKNPYFTDQYKIQEYKDSLRDHRFPADLTLKVGARVVLLYNLDHKRGLVNGSQGTVIGFGFATAELERSLELTVDHKEPRRVSMLAFQDQNTQPAWRPIVQFANGEKELIGAIASASLRGGSKVEEQYIVVRTQLPLMLAWALSIHKSQGMTLEYVEVNSRNIFETGQLYVALSRATHLNGLQVTGFNRNQMPMDKDVLEFYTSTKWEKLEARGKKG